MYHAPRTALRTPRTTHEPTTVSQSLRVPLSVWPGLGRRDGSMLPAACLIRRLSSVVPGGAPCKEGQSLEWAGDKKRPPGSTHHGLFASAPASASTCCAVECSHWHCRFKNRNPKSTSASLSQWFVVVNSRRVMLQGSAFDEGDFSKLLVHTGLASGAATD